MDYLQIAKKHLENSENSATLLSARERETKKAHAAALVSIAESLAILVEEIQSPKTFVTLGK